MSANKQPGFWGYRILGIVNLFVSVLFMFSAVVNLLMLGFDPKVVLIFFIAFAFLAYSNLTSVFARQVLVGRKPLSHRIRDWIRVNSIVTLVCSGIGSVLFVSALLNWSVVEQYIKENNIPLPQNFFLGALIFFTVSSILLLIHSLFTFKYLRQYGEYFQ